MTRSRQVFLEAGQRPFSFAWLLGLALSSVSGLFLFLLARASPVQLPVSGLEVMIEQPFGRGHAGPLHNVESPLLERCLAFIGAEGGIVSEGMTQVVDDLGNPLIPPV